MIRTTQSIIATLEMSFQFPVTKSRIFPVDHPEILLVSALVVATKICFLWTEVTFFVASDELPRLDWQQWEEATAQMSWVGAKQPSRPDLISITPDQVATMTESELDEYFGRMASLSDGKSRCIGTNCLVCSFTNRPSTRYQPHNAILPG